MTPLAIVVQIDIQMGSSIEFIYFMDQNRKGKSQNIIIFKFNKKNSSVVAE